MKESFIELPNHSVRTWINDDWTTTLNNVEITSKDDGAVFNIKEITAPFLGNHPDDFYAGISEKDGLLVVTTFMGICFIVDLDKKEVVERKFVK